MFIHFSADGVWKLEDPENFRSFKVVSASSKQQLAALDDAKRIGIELDGDDHMWLAEPFLRELVSRRDDAVWAAQFRDMISNAARYGWVDEQGRVRAHIEWRAGSLTTAQNRSMT